jgi:hypothetical protein
LLDKAGISIKAAPGTRHFPRAKRFGEVINDATVLQGLVPSLFAHTFLTLHPHPPALTALRKPVSLDFGA